MNTIILKLGKDFGINMKKDHYVVLETYEVTNETNFSYGISKVYKKKHEDGWTIKAKVIYNDRDWISEFEATHKIYGKIIADLDDEIIIESNINPMDAYNHFIKNHDYGTLDYYGR